MPPPSTLAELLRVSFPIEVNANVNIDDRSFHRALLAGLDAVYKAVNLPMRAVPDTINVTEVVTPIAAAAEVGRKVSVYNNGTEDVIILEGGSPVFNGQDESSVDVGAVLEPGDTWSTSDCHISVINARCRDDAQSSVTVTTYTRVS